MKIVKFQRLTLISHIENAARVVDFHPKLTIIKGFNDTGKSSILKSIYYTLGADVEEHPEWTKANILAILEFKIDDQFYSAKRNKNNICIYKHVDGVNTLIIKSNSITKQLSPVIADLFDFNLHLKTTNGTSIQALPAFKFLPYYIDQDQGWNSPLSGFTKLSQFSRWQDDLIDYHAGVKANSWYLKNNEIIELKLKIQELENRFNFVSQAISEIRNQVTAQHLTYNEDDFENSIINIKSDIQRITSEQYKLKLSILNEQKSYAAISYQIKLAKSSKSKLNKRFDLIIDEDHVICPTCGIDHRSTLEEQIKIAEDIGKHEDMVLELESKKSNLEKEISKLSSKQSSIAEQMRELNAQLLVKNAKLTVKDILIHKGREEYLNSLISESNSLTEELKSHQEDLKKLNKEKKELITKVRTKDITLNYKDFFQKFADELDVPLSEDFLTRLRPSLKESGSDMPRILLAYKITILHLIYNFGDSAYCPLVIDSLNQQDQDVVNLKSMFNLAINQTPGDTQLILAVVDDFGFGSNGHVIELKDKRNVLQKSFYEDAVAIADKYQEPLDR